MFVFKTTVSCQVFQKNRQVVKRLLVIGRRQSLVEVLRKRYNLWPDGHKLWLGEWAPRHILSLHGGCLVTGEWQKGSNWLIGGCPRSPKPSDCTISDCHSIGPVLSSHCHRLTVRNRAVAAWALEKSCWYGPRARQYPIQAKVGPACKWEDGIGAARSSSWRW